MVKSKKWIKLFILFVPSAAFFIMALFVTDLFVLPAVQGRFHSRILMPDLRDKDSVSALTTLRNAGLKVGEIRHAFHESVPKGCIILQQPESESRLKRNRSVRLTISLGEERVWVPDLRTLSPTQAMDTLQKLGLHLGEIRKDYSRDDATPGTIIASQPPMGGAIKKGGTVHLTIAQSSLTGTTRIPDFARLPLDKARKLLEQAGLILRQVTEEKDADWLPGTVLRQSVEAGSEVDRGTFIDFVVAE